jgi:phosphoglycerate dehydrogenase-like enzyme
MSKPRVVMTDFVTDPTIERAVLDDHVELVCFGARSPDELSGRVGDAAAMICFHDIEITAELLRQATQCRGVVRGGVGFNNVDIRAAGELGIVVCNVPDYGTEEVADHALGLLLALVRRIVLQVESVRGGAWDSMLGVGTPRLRGKTVGIVGCGRIGTAFAMRAKAVGLRVVFYDPYLPRGIEKSLAVERAWTLAELLPQCQFVSLHCPMTDETRGLLDAAALALLPRGAYLVNTARGGIVCESALLDALDCGQLAGAALDVLEREPLDNERMRRHAKLLITPHAAFYSDAAGPELRRKAAEEALRLVRGQAPVSPVNLQYLRNARTS